MNDFCLNDISIKRLKGADLLTVLPSFKNYLLPLFSGGHMHLPIFKIQLIREYRSIKIWAIQPNKWVHHYFFNAIITEILQQTEVVRQSIVWHLLNQAYSLRNTHSRAFSHITFWYEEMWEPHEPDEVLHINPNVVDKSNLIFCRQHPSITHVWFSWDVIYQLSLPAFFGSVCQEWSFYTVWDITWMSADWWHSCYY